MDLKNWHRVALKNIFLGLPHLATFNFDFLFNVIK
jgi:hypothetical protein